MTSAADTCLGCGTPIGRQPNRLFCAAACERRARQRLVRILIAGLFDERRTVLV